MEQLRKEMAQSRKSSSSKGDVPTVAPKTAAKSKPKAKPKAKSSHPSPDEDEDEPVSSDEGGSGKKDPKAPPDNKAARHARLRRCCERKPSGKIYVPVEVHEKWKNASLKERDQMVAELEAANWNKETVLCICSSIPACGSTFHLLYACYRISL